MLFIAGLNTVQSQATLTVSNTTYDLIADRNFDVGTSVAYAEGYDAGVASLNTTGDFTQEPTIVIDQDGDATLRFRTNLDNSPGVLLPIIRIIYSHERNLGRYGDVQYLRYSNTQHSTTLIGTAIDPTTRAQSTHFSIFIMNEHGDTARRENVLITYE